MAEPLLTMPTRAEALLEILTALYKSGADPVHSAELVFALGVNVEDFMAAHELVVEDG